jgi:hypothetical protein
VLFRAVGVTRVDQGVEEGLLAVFRFENYRHPGETSPKSDVAFVR